MAPGEPMQSSQWRIRKARALAEFSQAELARRVGVQRSAVTQWECQTGTIPSVGHLIRIALETGVCVEWLATGRGPCRADDGDGDDPILAVLTAEYAKDDFESRALVHLRQLPLKKKQAALEILEILAR